MFYLRFSVLRIRFIQSRKYLQTRSSCRTAMRLEPCANIISTRTHVIGFVCNTFYPLLFRITATFSLIFRTRPNSRVRLLMFLPMEILTPGCVDGRTTRTKSIREQRVFLFRPKTIVNAMSAKTISPLSNSAYNSFIQDTRSPNETPPDVFVFF